MTNFQAQPTTKSLRWLTPERAVLVLPIAAGLLVALALGSFVITPLSLRLQAKRQQVEALRQLRDELPLLEARLLAVNGELSERREQQDQLLQLVAGVSELDTLLAELNDLAEQRGVIITRAESGDIQSYQPPPQPVDGQDDVPPPAAGGEGAAQMDPLLREGLERRSAQLGVSGPFSALVAFMRALERLQVFVQISDLSVKQEGTRQKDNSQDSERNLDLELTLTAYGRQPAR
tara:strand:+ start:2577 stop:3278 length:702 start_codon:yes stop_codon:yes gene_type:complete